jgi:hypothetical protein
MPEHPTVQDVCRLAAFRVLAPSPAPELRGYSQAQGKLTGVTVAAGGVEVTTEIRQQVLYSLPDDLPPEDRARGRLHDLIDDWRPDIREPRSEAAQQLRIAAADREAWARADSARVRKSIIEVDGASVPFALVEHEGSWAAVADIGDESVTIAARGIPATAVALQTLLRN